MSIKGRIFAGLATAGLVFSGPAAAEDYYISASVGAVDQDNSTNNGTFTSQFVTGQVTGVTPPLTIPLGAPVSWTTEFDRGDFFALAVGRHIMGFRAEFEYRDSEADVDTHRGVSAADIDLSAIDAGVLITGNVGDLGVSVADLVAAGRGQIENSSFMVNGYYDFDFGSAIVPYLGAGIGHSDTDIEYAPSDVGIIRDSDNGFAWQFLAGVSFAMTDELDLYLNYRYFDADDVNVQSPLLTADFDIENTSQSWDVGIRYSF